MINRLKTCIINDDIKGVEKWEQEFAEIDGQLTFPNVTARVFAEQHEAWNVAHWLGVHRHLASGELTRLLESPTTTIKDLKSWEAKNEPLHHRILFAKNHSALDVSAAHSSISCDVVSFLYKSRMNHFKKQRHPLEDTIQCAIKAKLTHIVKWCLVILNIYTLTTNWDQIAKACLKHHLVGCFWHVREKTTFPDDDVSALARKYKCIPPMLLLPNFEKQVRKADYQYKAQMNLWRKQYPIMTKNFLRDVWILHHDSPAEEAAARRTFITHDVMFGFKLLNVVNDFTNTIVVALVAVPPGVKVIQSDGDKLRCSSYIVLQARYIGRKNNQLAAASRVTPLANFYAPIRWDDVVMGQQYFAQMDTDQDVQCAAGLHFYASVQAALKAVKCK